MKIPTGKSPVIIIGMHRSGTSMIARMLDKMGLFVGYKLDENHEATFFNKHNAWLLSASGGRWDTPRSIEYIYGDSEGQKLALRYLRDRLSGPPCVEFLGPLRFARYRSLFSIKEPWGWKDPRSTLTLPIWLNLFPDARIIHVIRNGVDVANSLYRRQQQGLSLARERSEKFRFAFIFRPKKGWFGASPRVINVDGGFSLWEEYLEYAERFKETMPNALLELKYEEFVASPEANLLKVSSFCGLDPDQKKVNKVSSIIRGGRSNSFEKDKALYSLWEIKKDSKWMKKYGYDALPRESKQE